MMQWNRIRFWNIWAYKKVIDEVNLATGALLVSETPHLVYDDSGKKGDIFMTYRIAGFGVKMEVHGRTFSQAVPYQDADAPVDFEVHGRTEQVLEKAPYLTRDEAEYISTGEDFFRKIIPYGSMMLHACTALVGDRAYLFSGPSGVGKSTHVALWEKYLGKERVLILNDDKPVLRMDGKNVLAYGVPWCGSAGIGINTCAPVAGICFLKQGNADRIYRMEGVKAVHAVLSQTVRDLDAKEMECLLNTIEDLIVRVPIYEMECLPRIEAARLSWEMLNRYEE